LTGLNTIIKNPVRDNFLFTSDAIFGDERYAMAEGNPMNGTFNILIPPSFSVEGWISYGYGKKTLCDLDGRNAVAILPLDNTVYRINYATGEKTPFCEVFPEEKMPEFKPMENYEVAQRAAIDARIMWLSSVFATKDYLIADNMVKAVIWNLETSEGYRTMGFRSEDAPEFPFKPLKIVGVDNKTNTFVCAYDASDFMDYYTTMPEKRPYKVKEHNTDNLNEDSNPVLMLYTLK